MFCTLYLLYFVVYCVGISVLVLCLGYFVWILTWLHLRIGLYYFALGRLARLIFVVIVPLWVVGCDAVLIWIAD